MFDSSLNAADRLTKARTQLLLDDVFWGSLSMKLIHVEDIYGQLPYGTIATNGKNLLYNKDYIESLTIPEVRAEIAHECGHLILKHHLRRDNREWELWNVACDQAVDWILHKADFNLAKKWVDRLESQYENDSAEIIYSKMLAARNAASKLKNQTGQQTGQPPPGGFPGSQPPAHKNAASKLKNQTGQQTGQPPPGGFPGSQPAAGTSAQPPPGSSPPSGAQPPSGMGNPSPQIVTDASQNPQPFPTPRQPIHGLICDAPIDFNNKPEVDEAEEDIDIALEAAGKLAGNLPGALETLVTANKTHQINYKALLREFLEATLNPGDYDWIPPDRTYLSMDMIVPGIVDEEELPNVLFACDSSGSIGPPEKKIFANEICGVLEDFPCTIKAVYCDTKVQHTQDITVENYPIKLEFKGGGGTNFAPVFEFIKDEELDPKAILYFTDLCCSDWGKDPGIPVLWMNTYRPNDNIKPPFGKIIPLELTQAQQAELELEFADHD